MKVLLLSDTHTEFGVDLPVVDCTTFDVIIAAGDIGHWTDGMVDLANKYPYNPIIYVAGNHEMYGTSRKQLLTEAAALTTKYPNFHFLENSSVKIGGINFWGATIWTDFDLYSNKESAIRISKAMISDHRMIEDINGWEGWHKDSLRSVDDFMGTNPDGPVVFITHHLPSQRSINPKYGASPLNASFASNLEDLMICYEPKWWFHGHSHSPSNYKIHNTTVVANPRGYPGENRNYTSLIIDLNESTTYD